MPTSTNVTNLKINELTEAQYDTAVQQGIIGAHELSILTDASSGDFVPQYTTMPTASADHAGKIVQYAGVASDYEQGYFYICNPVYVDSSATITQTTGSGLTNLAVDVATFEAAEQPTGAETIEFTASGSELVFNCDTDISGATVTCPDVETMAAFVGSQVGMPANWVIDQINAGQSFSFNAGQATGDKCEFSGTPLPDDFFDTYFVFDPEHANQSAYMFAVWGSVGETATWTKDGTPVNIANYGVTYSGTAVEGDVLTVVYTPYHIDGYVWEECYVQPESGGGEGIEWAVQLDFDHTQSYDSYAKPVWRIVGGLPNGTYEYYFQTIIDEGYNKVTYKVRLRLYDGDGVRRCEGYLACVYDGDFATYNPEFKPQAKAWWSYVYTDGNDLVLYNESAPFKSDMYSASYQPDIPGMFKITTIKNVDTGEEYIPEGHIKTSNESYNNYLDGNLQLYSLVDMPQIPYYFMRSSYSYTGTPNYFLFNNWNSIIGYPGTPYLSALELDILISTSLGGVFHAIIENTYEGYTAKLLKKEGDLINGRLLTNGYGGLVFDAGFATSDARDVYATFGLKGSTVSADVTTIGGGVEDYTTEITYNTVGATISTQNFGVVAQFNNEIEGALYTQGYFYKAAGTIVSVAATYIIDQITPNDVTITCTDAKGLVNAIATRTTWPQSYVKDLLKSNNTLSIVYDFDNGTILDMNIDRIGVLDSSEYAYFTVSGNYAGTTTIYASSTTFTDASQEIQNPHWEQVSVQDVNALLQTVTGYDATKTQVLKNVTGTLTWVDE